MANRTTSITANFPFLELTPFADDRHPPIFSTLRTLQRELNANATSVHSNDGGGLHGHLTLTVTPARYLQIAGPGNAFPAPYAPDCEPEMPDPATSARIGEAVRQHQESIQVFQLYHDVDKAIVRAIIAATPKAYIEILEDPELSFASVTALDLITHLRNTYGTMTATDRDANLARMHAPWAPPMLMETLFTQLETGQRIAALAAELIADSQLVQMGPFTVILPNGEAITSTHTAELDLGNIPLGAHTCHLFPHLRSRSLLSIRQLCDHGCEALFTHTFVVTTPPSSPVNARHHIVTGWSLSHLHNHLSPHACIPHLHHCHYPPT
jgi:hypothetical protein